MDKRTHQLYNDGIYQEALSRFGINPQHSQLLGGFESFIYEVEHSGREAIFRISHSLHLSPQSTRGEMDFLAYLVQHGLSVPSPYPSLQGNLVEVIPAFDPETGEETYFSVVLFSKAPGGPPRKEDWTPELFFKMGHFLGRLHRLSQAYQPSQPDIRRNDWYQDKEDYARRYLPPSDTIILEKFSRLVAHLKALSREPQSYGLNHLDFHRGNFFLYEGEITLFDFDDCAYAPYVYDIAMALFYAVPHRCDTPEALEQARIFYKHLLQGYFQEFNLERSWLKEIPYFLKLREMDLYIVIHRSCDLENLGPWLSSYMDGRRQRLENDIPYIDMDFS